MPLVHGPSEQVTLSESVVPGLISMTLAGAVVGTLPVNGKASTATALAERFLMVQVVIGAVLKICTGVVAEVTEVVRQL